MILGKSVLESMGKLDKELDNYFNNSRKYRCRLRTGYIVVVDPDNSLFDFLIFLIRSCNIEVRAIHVKSVHDAKKIVKEKSGNLKAVIIDASMVDVLANGNSLPTWMDKNLPNVPVWINNCEPDQEKLVRKLSARAGIILDGKPDSDFVDILGFPCEAKKYITEHK